MKISSSQFRSALSRFATGVTVVTVMEKGAPKGITISSFTSLSLEPPLILFCLDNRARLATSFKKDSAFAVNILGEDQKQLAQFFATQSSQDWKKISYKSSGAGPLLEEALASLSCEVEKIIPAGDHKIIIGRVKKIGVNKKISKPLLYTARQYHALGKVIKA